MKIGKDVISKRGNILFKTKEHPWFKTFLKEYPFIQSLFPKFPEQFFLTKKEKNKKHYYLLVDLQNDIDPSGLWAVSIDKKSYRYMKSKFKTEQKVLEEIVQDCYGPVHGKWFEHARYDVHGEDDLIKLGLVNEGETALITRFKNVGEKALQDILLKIEGEKE